MPSTALISRQFNGRQFYAISYDGVDDFASVPANANYALSSDKSMSVGIWMRTSSSGSWCPFARSLAGMATSRMALFRVNGVTNAFYGSFADATVIMPSSLHDGNWHFTSMTFDKRGNLSAFVDGVKIGDAAYTPAAAGSFATIIGKYSASDGGIGENIYQFQGDIAEVCMWSRAVTGPEWIGVCGAGPNGVSQMLTRQLTPSRKYFVPAAGGAAPWLYARRPSRIIGGGVS